MWYLRRIAGVTRVCLTYADRLNGRVVGSASGSRTARGGKGSDYGEIGRCSGMSQCCKLAFNKEKQRSLFCDGI